MFHFYPRGLAIRCAVGALLFTLGLGALQAQTFPTKPLTLVVPFVPGGTTDIIGRIVAEGLGKRLDQAVIIDNRGGAGGNIGAAFVAQAKPDGYTLLLGYNGTNAINPSLYKQLPWDPVKSFEPLSLVARVNNVIIVNPNLPIKNIAELVSYAKLHPGELNYGSAGAGSIFHLAGEMMEQETKATLTHVPYKGAAPALNDLMGGQIQLMFSTIPAALPFVKAGRLRAIGVTGAKRSPLFPDLQSTSEAGFPGLVVDSWFAVFAPRGLAAPIQASLTKALHEVLTDPAIVQKMELVGAQVHASTPSELAQLLQSDLQTWKVVLQKAKVKLD